MVGLGPDSTQERGDMDRTLETKMRILDLISARPMSLADLSAVLKLRSQAIMQHLRALEEAGMVREIDDPDTSRPLYCAVAQEIKMEIRAFVATPTSGIIGHTLN